MLDALPLTTSRFPALDHRLWRPLLIFTATRLVLLAAGFFSRLMIPELWSLFIWHPLPGVPLLDMWTNWDGRWYGGIAANGYYFIPGIQSSVAFFPLYPLLMRLVGTLIGDPVIAGILISNLAFLGALVVLYCLTEELTADRETATRTIFYLALFPTALFFSALYTESLFLLCVLLAFYAARHDRWWIAGIAGALAAATRVIGVGLFGVLLLMWLQANGWHILLKPTAWRSNFTALAGAMRRKPFQLLAIGLVPLGLLTYIVYLQIAFGHPFAFLEAQREWGNTPTGPIAVLLNTINLVTTGADVWGEPPLADLIAFAGAFLLSLVAWRKFGYVYGLYSLMCLMIPISSTYRSMIRYVVVIFPMFMALAVWGRNRILNWIVMLGFTIATIAFMITYASWRFVG
jgi:hypothetical protein